VPSSSASVLECPPSKSPSTTKLPFWHLEKTLRLRRAEIVKENNKSTGKEEKNAKYMKKRKLYRNLAITVLHAQSLTLPASVTVRKLATECFYCGENCQESEAGEVLGM
jgi:hypothetical protein